MLWQIIHIIEVLFWLLLSASGAYILFYTIVSLIWRKPVSKQSSKVKSLHADHYYSFLVLFPAYNEDRVIVSSIQQFISQYYPNDRFHAVVISDHMKPETNDKLRELPITLLTPVFEKTGPELCVYFTFSGCSTVPGAFPSGVSRCPLKSPERSFEFRVLIITLFFVVCSLLLCVLFFNLYNYP